MPTNLQIRESSNGNGDHGLPPWHLQQLIRQRQARRSNGHVPPGGGTVIVNSREELNALQERESYERTQARKNQVKNLLGFVNNLGASDLIRTEFLRFLLDGPREIDAECGYPAWLTPDHYRAMYDREGIAKRVVDCEPMETWAIDPDVYESEEEGVQTKFEKAWEAFVKQWNVWNYLQRIDILSGIGQYGIMVFGLNDQKPLHEPVDGFEDDGSFTASLDLKLLYMRPFTEEVTFIKTRDVDPTSPRFSQPKMYTIQFRDFPNWGIQAGEVIARDVHWSRVLHVADNLKISEIYGTPRMQQVYNRLYDCRKVYAASAEAYWKGAFPGIAFEVNPEVADQGLQLDTESIRKEMERFQASTQRYFAVQGVTAKTMPPSLVDPTPTIEAALKAIAISKGIPYRKLFGSEEAKLAGDQDERAWNAHLKRRQISYVNPKIIRPFIERMQQYGVLPPTKNDYEIEWEDLNTPTDDDKADVLLKRTQALQAYVMGNVSQLIPPLEFLVKEMGYTMEEAKKILDSSADFNSDGDTGLDDPDDEQEEDKGSEGGLDQANPDNGNVLDQKNLSRSTTTSKGRNTVESELVQMPSLNSRGKKIKRKKGKKGAK
jgi:uncharacterized protein